MNDLKSGLSEDAFVLLLDHEHLHVERFLLNFHRLDLLKHLLVGIARFLEDEHDHAHRDKQLQDGRDEETNAGERFKSL